MKIDPIRMSDLVRDRDGKMTFTVHAVLIRDWRFRLGLQLMKWGARVAGYRVEVKDAGPAPGPEDMTP